MLQGKVALITGAGQGIGQGTALALARRGAKVAVVGRTVSKCEETCRLIAEGIRLLTVTALVVLVGVSIYRIFRKTSK